jgi:hypothetical protein
VDTLKVRVLIAVVVAMVLIIGAGVAYAANNSASAPPSTGDRGAQVVGNEDSDGADESAEEPGDADEPGDSDGPGDTEDAD